MWLRNSLKQERDATMIVNGVTLMQQVRIYLLLAVLICTVTTLGQTVVTTPAVVTSARVPATLFRDCSDCPEMVVVPAGNFTMGSSAAEKLWAASHGASLGSVADEAPQHKVSLRSFALGEYDVTRREYAVFVRETGHPSGDGCGKDSFKWDKQPDLNWQNPGFIQTDRDPVVCVSWNDARVHQLVEHKGARIYIHQWRRSLPPAQRSGMGICGARWNNNPVLVGR